MDALVDYDNVPATRRRSAVHLVETVIRSLGASALPPRSRVRFRLYGGWYEQRRPTRLAQRLTAELQAQFPRPVTVRTSGGQRHRVVAVVELATSVLIAPNSHLFHTYRPGRSVRRMRCKSPPEVGCSLSACPIPTIKKFFDDWRCPGSGCSVRPSNVLSRGEQKLVDTMLATDLAYLALNSSDPVSVISSDDDFWPTILLAAELNKEVIHVSTKPSSRPFPYSLLLSSSAPYRSTSL